MELAKRAVELDEEFAGSHYALGTAYTARGRHAEAIAAARRAIELQPGDADSHANCARCLMFSGAGDDAAEMVRVALRLDPQYVEGPYLNLLGRSLFVAERYAESVEAFERNRNRGGPATPAGGAGLNWIAACCLAGRAEAVPALLQELLRHHPSFTLAKLRDYRGMFSEGELEHLLKGLRKAGLPE